MEAVPVGRVAIDSIEVQLLGTFPMHATVIARGHLPNDCTELKPINPYFDVSTFKVSIFMARVMSNTCRNTLRPFESVIPLNIKGLRAGVYTVNVNGVIGNFRLSADNGIR
jgi:inhibitor of cysteine peptidase